MTAAETVWPVTVAGWIGLAMSLLALVTAVISWNRAAAHRATKEAQDEARTQRTDDNLSAFRMSVERELNGFGARLERLEEDGRSRDTVVNGVLQSLAEAAAERRHVGETLARIEKGMDALRDMVVRVLNPRES